MAVWGGLTNSCEKKRSQKKGEKERYIHLNAEFQGIARRDKKAFLRDQCKEIEENNRMGKTTDLFKKIRDTKGIFHAKMGWRKDRNGLDLTEAEDIKKRWQEYTEKLYKKDLHDPLSWWCDHSSRARHPGMWSQVALESITMNKASGGDGIPVELFQILKDDAVEKCCTQYVSKFGKLSSGHRTGKGHFSFQFQRKAMPKNAQTTAQVHSSHMLVK